MKFWIKLCLRIHEQCVVEEIMLDDWKFALRTSYVSLGQRAASDLWPRLIFNRATIDLFRPLAILTRAAPILPTPHQLTTLLYSAARIG